MSFIRKLLTVAALLTCTTPVFAHTIDAHQQHATTPTTDSTQQAWGTPGQASAVTRTITLRMSDDMRFTPDQLHIKLGETVRLRVKNVGAIMHEIVLGTAQTLDAHAAAMLQSPTMAHGDAFMAHVPPQQNGELIWTFNRPGSFDFACLIAGHFQAGMHGSITVTP